MKNKVLICFSLFALLLCSCRMRGVEPLSLGPFYTPIADGRIEYYRLGNGSPIVLIPGYATDVSSWSKAFLMALAKHHQLIIINNRNVGGSQVHSSRYDSQDLANDDYQLIKNLKLKKPTVLGISMGGMIAQQVAVLHPDVVGKLVLINTIISGHKGKPPSEKMKNTLINIPRNKLGFYKVAVSNFFPENWKFRMAYKLVVDRFQPPKTTEIDLNDIINQQQHLIRDWTNDDLTAEKLHKLSMPVLILNGEADIVIPPVNSVILAHAIPHSKLLRWKEGGHAMIYQYPEEIANKISRFIDSTSENSSTKRNDSLPSSTCGRRVGDEGCFVIYPALTPSPSPAGGRGEQVVTTK